MYTIEGFERDDGGYALLAFVIKKNEETNLKEYVKVYSGEYVKSELQEFVIDANQLAEGKVPKKVRKSTEPGEYLNSRTDRASKNILSDMGINYSNFSDEALMEYRKLNIKLSKKYKRHGDGYAAVGAAIVGAAFMFEMLMLPFEFIKTRLEEC